MEKRLLLANDRVALLPLQKGHWEALWPVAQQVDVHRYGPSDISSPEKLRAYIDTALQEAVIGSSIPFAVMDKCSEEIVGSTRFGRIDPKNKVVHIGWTWIAPAVQGSGLNHEMKYLMLSHAFEVMVFEKVAFRIDERNIRSRKAVEKLGAQLEGILRKNVIVKNGFRRSSCCYGILREAWPIIKEERFAGYSSSTGSSIS